MTSTPIPLLPRDRWKNQSGAFDLPSILVGVVVVGILTAGVLAAIFGVIPFAQDRAAKQDLASVNTAQGSALTKDGGFLGKAGLIAAGLLGSGLPEDLDIRATADGECYVAVGTSGTSERFITSSEETGPRALVPADTWCDGTPVTPGPDTGPEPEEPAVVPEPEPTSDLEPVMISTWNTALATTCNTITLPVTGFDGTVDWGDGTVDNKISHTYTARGEVKIRIDGTFDSWGTPDVNGAWDDAVCLISVDRWGATETTDLSRAFSRANNLKHVESIPATTTSLRAAFWLNTSNFTLGALDTSNVTTMFAMFNVATAFNQPLNFDTSNVTNMGSMFHGATRFNQPLNFDTSKVTNMVTMFQYASSFNQDLSAWNVSKVATRANFSTGATAWKLPQPKWVR